MPVTGYCPQIGSTNVALKPQPRRMTGPCFWLSLIKWFRWGVWGGGGDQIYTHSGECKRFFAGLYGIVVIGKAGEMSNFVIFQVTRDCFLSIRQTAKRSDFVIY